MCTFFHFTNSELEFFQSKIIYTCFEEIPFLGKVSYPYGYQKPNKQVIIRTYQKARNIEFIDKVDLLAKTNSQIGT